MLTSVLLVFFGAGRVLSQELVFSEPVRLGSSVNSEVEELSPLMSADSKTLYFSRAFCERNTGGKFAGTDIWVSKKDEQGQWLPAVNMGNSWNNKLSNSVIGINQDHSVVYLLNAYSNKSGISFSKFYSGTWGSPEFIPIPGINRDDFVGFYANPKFDVILISMKGKDSFGEEDLYVSLKDSFGSWTEPKNLGATINTKGFEISPFLTEDKKRLFFSSNGHGGFGDADIFYCDRLYDSWETWTVPRNLGEYINSEQFDAYFAYHSDSLITFVSNRSGSSADIFMTKTDSKSNAKSDSSEVIYLADTEVKKIFGENFSLSIRFEKNSSMLSVQHNNQIVHVAQMLNIDKGLKMHLVARRGQNSTLLEINKLRLIAILEELRKSGIEGSRITFGSEIVRLPVDEDDRAVFFKFYR